MKKEMIEDFFNCRCNCKFHKPVTDIVVPLYLANRLMLEESEKICKKHGITNSELDVLRTLDLSEKALSPTELYEGMLFSSGGMTKILKRLELQGFIKRIPNKSDKRSTLVEITEKGVEISKNTIEEIISDKEKVFSCLDENEQEVMKKALKKVVTKLIS